jgi:hypothetical protein
MTEPITYSLSFGMSNLNLALTDDRFVSRGSMQNVDVPLSSLRNFCVVPTKNDVGAYDSELIVSWDEAGKPKSKKIYVRGTDTSFQQFVAALKEKRPDASLLHLDPKSAQKQMGVLSTSKFAWIAALGIVGLILLLVIVVGLLSVLR